MRPVFPIVVLLGVFLIAFFFINRNFFFHSSTQDVSQEFFPQIISDDSITFQLSATDTLTVPIHDPNWASLKDSWVQVELVEPYWADLSHKVSRQELEGALERDLAIKFYRDQETLRKKMQPIISKIVTASLLARRPQATAQEKAKDAAMTAKYSPWLNQITKNIQTYKIVLKALLDDSGLPVASIYSDGSVHAKP